MFYHASLSTCLTKDEFKGDETFIIKKGIVLFELLRTKKVCYIYVSDFLQKSLTDRSFVIFNHSQIFKISQLKSCLFQTFSKLFHFHFHFITTRFSFLFTMLATILKKNIF